jgi:hypothetical protein
MATTVVDSPPSPDGAPQGAENGAAGIQPPGAGDPGAPAGPAAPAPAVRCASCGAPMAAGQDWCMQCGAGAPDSIGARAWRPWAIALGATAVLLLGAAAAAYAALNKEPKKAAVTTATVAQAPPPAVPTTPTPSTPAVKTPPIAKAPHVKLKATPVTPVATTPVTPATTPTTPATKEEGTPTSGTGGSGSEAQPAPILLDTDAASTYNPYGYAASGFGDPSLTIDGDTGTGWSAEVNPATAPAMAEGVVIDLKSAKKLSSVKLVTSTPGITLQIYGAAGKTAPASITDEAWVPLSRSLTVKKRRAKIGLKNKTKAVRFVTVWISGAPASAVGTPEAPGKITLNEIELFKAT